jgi:L-alanine-DL-glutamate epimerase-like enolase superfamily enzyme
LLISSPIPECRAVAPAFSEASLGWLEEPFPAHDYRGYFSVDGNGVIWPSDRPGIGVDEDFIVASRGSSWPGFVP